MEATRRYAAWLPDGPALDFILNSKDTWLYKLYRQKVRPDGSRLFITDAFKYGDPFKRLELTEMFILEHRLAAHYTLAQISPLAKDKIIFSNSFVDHSENIQIIYISSYLKKDLKRRWLSK